MPEVERHSAVGASSAYRWMNCPGSVRLLKQVKHDIVSDYAITGTVAHSICESCLKDPEGTTPQGFLGLTLKDLASGKDVLVTEEMVNAVDVYVNKVLKDKAYYGGDLVVEQEFDLSWMYPGMFGRNDACLYPAKDKVLRIYDYKNGRKPVRATENPQCMFYAVGAIGENNEYKAQYVECNIIQPNCVGKVPVDSWTIDTFSLWEWANDVLVPAARRTEDPDAPCHVGEWCCFCEAAGICPAKKEAALSLLEAKDTADITLPPAKSLTPEALGKLSAFFTSDEFTSWVKSLAAEEQALLAQGVEIPGRKLIETKVLGNRKWADEGEVLKEFKGLGGGIFTTKLKSPAQIEKLMAFLGIPKAERESRVSKLVTREEGTKVIVVNESDARVSVAEEKRKAVELF